MGLVARFTSKDILTALENDKKKIETAMLNAMALTGETWAKEAKDGVDISGAFPKGDYTDRTGNLRSSIGYEVLNNGQIVQMGFSGNAEGIAAGQAAVDSVPKSGYQLIGAAGMEYASYVEDMGYNVITSQVDSAFKKLTSLLKGIATRSGKKGVDVDISGANFIGTSVIRR